MGILSRKPIPSEAAGLSANGLIIRVGDRVTWRDRIVRNLKTGTVIAVTTAEAKVEPDEIYSSWEVLTFPELTVSRQCRDDDKSAALVAVYKALHGLADAGDLTAYTFLTNDWPELVPADVRALLGIGPDAEADGDR